MAYDEDLAGRVREVLAEQPGLAERKMFGGLCFTLNGHMCCGITSDRLMLRLGNEGAAEALDEPHAREMDFTGRPMRSMVYIEPPGYAADADLRRWVERAAAYARGLPPK